MLQYFIAFLLIIATWVWFLSRPSRFPPGPLCLPVIGHVFSFRGNETYRSRFKKFQTQYGPMMSTRSRFDGSWEVLIQDFNLIKEILHDPRFSSRTNFCPVEGLGLNRGIAFTSGEVAKEKRKVILQTLRSLGVGKSTFSTLVEEETEKFLQYLEKKSEHDLNIKTPFAYVTNNIITRLMFNVSCGFDEKKQLRILSNTFHHFELIFKTDYLLFLPSFLFRFSPKIKKLKMLRRWFHEVIIHEVNRKRDYNSTITNEHSASTVLDQLWKIFGKNSETFPFPEEDIPYVLMDLFMAGQETTTCTLSWYILNLLHKPDIQEKIYEELLNEFPERDQIIGFSAVTSCNYLMATIHEAQRFTPVSFSSLDHTATVDIENLWGYRIPKGTRMYPNFALMNNDPQIWKFPLEFNPNNFSDEDGKFQKNQYLTPFSLGLRSCPGESIAKTEICVVIANLLRRFKICPANSGYIPQLDIVPNFVFSPLHYKVQLRKREK